MWLHVSSTAQTRIWNYFYSADLLTKVDLNARENIQMSRELTCETPSRTDHQPTTKASRIDLSQHASHSSAEGSAAVWVYRSRISNLFHSVAPWLSTWSHYCLTFPQRGRSVKTQLVKCCRVLRPQHDTVSWLSWDWESGLELYKFISEACIRPNEAISRLKNPLMMAMGFYQLLWITFGQLLQLQRKLILFCRKCHWVASTHCTDKHDW